MSYSDPNSIVESLHPGHPHDSVHPDESTCYKAKYPVVETNKYYQALNSLNFGSTSQLQIPNAGVVKAVILQGYFSGSATAAVVSAAGYAMISQIQYRIGNSTLYTITGNDNWNIIQSQLRTQESIQEAYSISGGDAGAIAVGTTREFQVHISTPYSRFMLMARQYGIDSTIFHTPIQLFVTLKTQALVYTADFTISSLQSANFQVLQSEYMDRSNRLVPVDGKFLVLPTRYFQSYFSRSFTPTNSATVNSIDLLSFRKGNLIGMIITAVDQANYYGTSPFKYNSIRDLNILFNGVSVYRSLGTSYKIQQLRDSVGAFSYCTAYSQKNYRIEVVFTPIHYGAAGMNFNYGLMLNSQTLQATFTIDDSINAQLLNVIYVYDAAIMYNEHSQDIVL